MGVARLGNSLMGIIIPITITIYRYFRLLSRFEARWCYYGGGRVDSVGGRSFNYRYGPH
jgi:hypothetical protein